MYTFTNHFSKSELNSRIRMINKTGSSAVVLLRYPVLLLAVITVASAFVRPQQVRRLIVFVPEPITKVLTNVTEPMAETASAEIVESSPISTTVVQYQPVNPKVLAKSGAGSAIQETSHDVAPASPSRYMKYDGDRLYWIVTPRTSFDDLAIMKQEFERHGYKMQIQNLKYDPLNTYISAIKVTILRPIVGVSDFEETGINGGPIRAHGGYNGINTLKTVAVVGSYPFKMGFVPMPTELLKIAHDEELFTTEFVRNNRMKYLLANGTKISREYAPGSSLFSVKVLLTSPAIFEKYGIRLNRDSTLAISNSRLPIFINNELVPNEVAKRIVIRKFDKLMSSEEFGRNGQAGTVRALLFYTLEDN